MDNESDMMDNSSSFEASFQAQSDMDLDLKSFLQHRNNPQAMKVSGISNLKKCPFCLQPLPKYLSIESTAILKQLLLPENSALSGENDGDKAARKHVSKKGMQLRVTFCGRHIHPRKICRACFN
jgi:hypothetical protein